MATPVWSLCGGMVVLLAGAAMAGRREQDPLPIQTDGYTSWYKANGKPFFISSKLDLLCRMPTPEQLAEQAKDPHVHKFVTVYTNPKGEAAMQKGGSFPEGSVIVKQKFTAPRWTTSAKESERDIATVMIKRQKGFNPKCGDWEFAVLDKTGENVTARGKLENCMSCHVAQSKSDFVFRTYLPKP